MLVVGTHHNQYCSPKAPGILASFAPICWPLSPPGLSGPERSPTRIPLHLIDASSEPGPGSSLRNMHSPGAVTVVPAHDSGVNPWASLDPLLLQWEVCFRLVVPTGTKSPGLHRVLIIPPDAVAGVSEARVLLVHLGCQGVQWEGLC
jgi:hypothetical protein